MSTSLLFYSLNQMKALLLLVRIDTANAVHYSDAAAVKPTAGIATPDDHYWHTAKNCSRVLAQLCLLLWRLGGAAFGRAGASSEPVVATLSSPPP
ncbi:MAG: hypothetical protein EOO68_31325 [Moraxellaceae bacterium]|nr:MAG: hypothetical protein EOO68_31325 [Moraxellaceae bacterium]